MRYLNFLVLLLVTSCGSQVRRERVPQDQGSYQTSGIERFYLTQLPEWANVSTAGKCRKSRSIQYFDFKRLNQTYQLPYRELLELQAQYNARVEEYFRSTPKNFLKPQEESSFFANTLEQVRGGIRRLNLPAVKSVNLIWLEGFQQLGQEGSLVSMAREGRMDEQLPLLYSSCLSRAALERWIADHDLGEVGFYLLPAEWLSPHGPDLELGFGLHLDLDELIGKNIKINFLSPLNIKLNPELKTLKE
jgi:hypothetical protein